MAVTEQLDGYTDVRLSMIPLTLHLQHPQVTRCYATGPDYFSLLLSNYLSLFRSALLLYPPPLLTIFHYCFSSKVAAT